MQCIYYLDCNFSFSVKAFVIHFILVVNGGYLLYDVSHSKTASHLRGRW